MNNLFIWYKRLVPISTLISSVTSLKIPEYWLPSMLLFALITIVHFYECYEYEKLIKNGVKSLCVDFRVLVREMIILNFSVLLSTNMLNKLFIISLMFLLFGYFISIIMKERKK